MITTLSKNDGSTMTNWEESAVLLMETLLPDDEVTEDTEEHLRLRERMENDATDFTSSAARSQGLKLRASFVLNWTVEDGEI
uniref:Uncharacterized protein n=1 Tax=Timema genevievae TaxID=629358 RepID=A0A7R9PPJ4_TIMGE|nr:unnamed protein product [Timema genevievae]